MMECKVKETMMTFSRRILKSKFMIDNLTHSPMKSFSNLSTCFSVVVIRNGMDGI